MTNNCFWSSWKNYIHVHYKKNQLNEPESPCAWPIKERSQESSCVSTCSIFCDVYLHSNPVIHLMGDGDASLDFISASQCCVLF